MGHQTSSTRYPCTARMQGGETPDQPRALAVSIRQEGDRYPLRDIKGGNGGVPAQKHTQIFCSQQGSGRGEPER